jgi:hypothetical protein
MQSVRSYIRAQGASSAVINAVLNPAISWLGNRQMNFVPLSGIAVDTLITCIVMSLLVSLFVTPPAQRQFGAGRLTGSNADVVGSGILAHFPTKAWSLGLLIGIIVAAIVTPLMFAAFRMFGSPGLSFVGFIILKALYTAVLGFVVTRWVILRQMLHCRARSAEPRSVGYRM